MRTTYIDIVVGYNRFFDDPDVAISCMPDLEVIRCQC